MLRTETLTREPRLHRIICPLGDNGGEAFRESLSQTNGEGGGGGGRSQGGEG